MKLICALGFIFWAMCSRAQQLAPSAYQNYQSAFWNAAGQNFGNEVKATSPLTGVFVTNRFLNRSMKTAFDKSDIRLSVEVPKRQLSPQPSSVDLHVDKVFQNCDLCPKCSLSPTDWGGCVCSTATLALKASCDLTNGLMNSFGGITFGKLSFSNVAAGGHVEGGPLSVTFDPSLMTAQIAIQAISGQGTAEGNVDWIWTSLNGLFTACPPQSFTIPSTTVSLTDVTLPMITNMAVKEVDDRIDLALSISGGDAHVKVENPGITLFNANKQIIMTCPVAFAYSAIQTVAGELLPLKFKFDIPAKNFDLTLSALNIPSSQPNKKVSLSIKKTGLAIGGIVKGDAPAAKPKEGS